MCPTCPSPTGGALIPNQAFPLTIKGKDVAGGAPTLPECWSTSGAYALKGWLVLSNAIELRVFDASSASVCRLTH